MLVCTFTVYMYVCILYHSMRLQIIYASHESHSFRQACEEMKARGTRLSHVLSLSVMRKGFIVARCQEELEKLNRAWTLHLLHVQDLDRTCFTFPSYFISIDDRASQVLKYPRDCAFTTRYSTS